VMYPCTVLYPGVNITYFVGISFFRFIFVLFLRLRSSSRDIGWSKLEMYQVQWEWVWSLPDPSVWVDFRSQCVLDDTFGCVKDKAPSSRLSCKVLASVNLALQLQDFETWRLLVFVVNHMLWLDIVLKTESCLVSPFCDHLCYPCRYKGWIDALQTVWREEGTKGLFRGALPRVLWFVPASAVSFMAVEWLRKEFNPLSVNSQPVLPSSSPIDITSTLSRDQVRVNPCAESGGL
jgi:hypothetical protein